MASYTETKHGHRAQLCVKGQRDSATFPTKREAQAWAAKRETELRNQAAGTAHRNKTLADAFDRYMEETGPQHDGWRWEQTRLAALSRPASKERPSALPVRLRLGAITPEHLAAWRDDRLKEVAPGTVLREIALLRSVFEVARREWRWVEKNPVKDIRSPSKPQHRERVITLPEIKATLRALEYRPGVAPRSITQVVALTFLAALRTGMRASEITALTWPDYRKTYARLHTSKTGAARDVPLSSKARRIFEAARGFDPVRVFPVAPQTRDVIFRRARKRAGLDGFTFHDARHTAATWIANSGKWSMLELCKAFGWRDPKHALIYFNPTATDLAGKLG